MNDGVLVSGAEDRVVWTGLTGNERFLGKFSREVLLRGSCPSRMSAGKRGGGGGGVM